MKNGVERVKTNVSEDDLLEQVFELNLATITLVKSRTKRSVMSERSLTIWKLLVTFSVLSIIAAGFSIYPKNKKYGKIIAKSSRTFGTDKELENVIEYLEKRLEQRGYYNFALDKQPMRLTNVLTLADGSGPGSRRSRSALRCQ